MLIHEFYSNMHGFDFSILLFGTCIVVTSDIVTDVLRVPRVKYLDYLGCDHLRTVSKDELISSVHSLFGLC